MAILCPKCGSPARRVSTKYGFRNRCCDLWSWDDAPLVDAETHEARKFAHACFDGLWQSGKMSRGEAYRRLAEELGISSANCHMKLMDAETAWRVVQAVPRIRKKLAQATAISAPNRAPVATSARGQSYEPIVRNSRR